MSIEVESYLRQVLSDSDVPADLLDPQAVVGLGHRVRVRRRRQRTAVGLMVASVLSLGVAEAVVPATGTPLSPVIWAAGPEFSGTEAGAWMQANGNRYVMSIRAAYLSERATLVVFKMRPDGSLREMMSSSPVSPQGLPDGGMSVSTDVGVAFYLFPAGATDITPITNSHEPMTVSTMRISSPHGGPAYVAVTVGSTAAGSDSISGYTWTDSAGRVHRSGGSADLAAGPD